MAHVRPRHGQGRQRDLADLHTYFETIGLPSGIEEPEPEPEPEPDEFAELDQEIEEEARRQAEEIIRQQEAEKQRLLEEQQAKEAAEREAEEKARREEEAAKAKPEPILLEEDGSPVGHARFIELLQDMKLSSERRAAISQSPKQSCNIHVSSIEKTLMGQGPMKNGMTVIGTLSENRDIEVELQLPSKPTNKFRPFSRITPLKSLHKSSTGTLDESEPFSRLMSFNYS